MAQRTHGADTPELGRLENLESMNLDYNQLSGEIPPEIGNLLNLKRLALYGNQLSGEIPPEIGNLSLLESLVLGSNELSGDLPPELGDLAALRWLDVTCNHLTGDVPDELGQLKTSNTSESRKIASPVASGRPVAGGSRQRTTALPLGSRQRGPGFSRRDSRYIVGLLAGGQLSGLRSRFS